MSGFFMLSPRLLRATTGRLSGRRFKLLLDLVVAAPRSLRLAELPFRFEARRPGRSKLDVGVSWAFAAFVARKSMQRLGSHFGRFCAIGCSGVGVHLAVLGAMQGLFAAGFALAQTTAAIVSTTSNFWLNNRLTFADHLLSGATFAAGLARFATLCRAGALVNVGSAEATWRLGVHRLSAPVAGMAAGAACNDLGTLALVWRERAWRGR